MKGLIRNVVLFFLLAWVQVASANASALEEEAAGLFQQGKYEEALQAWNLLLSEGHRTAGVYFNIGLSESQLQRIPESMLSFEKARRIKPYSKAIQLAVDAERSKIAGAVVPAKPFFLKEYYVQFLAWLRPGAWTFFGLVCCAGYVLFQLRWRSKTLETGNSILVLKRALILLGLTMLVCGVLAYKSLYRSDEAIVMQACELKQAPDSGSPLLSQLPAGEKVAIMDSLSGWYQVRLLNFEEGWIAGKGFARIIP